MEPSDTRLKRRSTTPERRACSKGGGRGARKGSGLESRGGGRHPARNRLRSKEGLGRQADTERDPLSGGHRVTTKGVGASERGATRRARSTGGEAGRSMTVSLLPSKGLSGSEVRETSPLGHRGSQRVGSLRRADRTEMHDARGSRHEGRAPGSVDTAMQLIGARPFVGGGR
jgi:hypothetical protein